VSVVSAEVEDGAAEDEVEGGVGVGDVFDGFDAEVVRGESGKECAGVLDCCGILVRGEDLVAFTMEVDEVATGAAASVEDAHAGLDIAAEKLVEEINVDEAELFVEGRHGFHA
jgi:hypothetical protein